MTARWASLSDLLSTQIANMPAEIGEGTNAAFDNPAFRAAARRTSTLNQAVSVRINNISKGVVSTAVQDFLSSQVSPLIRQQIDEMLALLMAEVDTHSTATPTGTSGGPSTHPVLDRNVATMVERAQAMQRDAQTPSGTPAANQHIRFTVNSLMGDDNGAGTGATVRTDYMSGIVTQFNRSFRDKATESDFEARSVGGPAPAGGTGPAHTP